MDQEGKDSILACSIGDSTKVQLQGLNTSVPTVGFLETKRKKMNCSPGKELLQVVSVVGKKRGIESVLSTLTQSAGSLCNLDSEVAITAISFVLLTTCTRQRMQRVTLAKPVAMYVVSPFDCTNTRTTQIGANGVHVHVVHVNLSPSMV